MSDPKLNNACKSSWETIRKIRADFLTNEYSISALCRRYRMTVPTMRSICYNTNYIDPEYNPENRVKKPMKLGLQAEVIRLRRELEARTDPPDVRVLKDRIQELEGEVVSLNRELERVQARAQRSRKNDNQIRMKRKPEEASIFQPGWVDKGYSRLEDLLD